MNEKELRKKFADTAISYVGSDEGSSKHKYIIDTYNQIVPLPVGYRVKYTDAWCATFVSFIAKECGLLDIIPAECGCGRQIALWKKLCRWEENDSYVPKVSDIVYYDWNDTGVGDNKGTPDHVGIVVSVSDGEIKVIEGNINNSVGYRTIDVNGKFIRGYGKPNFASKVPKKQVKKESVCNVELKVLKQGSKGDSVKALQILLMGYGYSCGSSKADGQFGPATLSAVRRYQKAKGLSIDGSVGPATWASLLGK